MKRRVAIVIAVLALAGCSDAGHSASARPSRPAAHLASGISPAHARQVFARFLAAFKRAEAARGGEAMSRLMTGPEEDQQNFQPDSYGPVLDSRDGERFYVPRLSGYPRWFVATGRGSGSAASFLFLLAQSAAGAPWLGATELYDFGLPGQKLPDLADVAVDPRGYATAVGPGDTSLAVSPEALSAGFSRYFNAAVSHAGATPAPSGYSSNVVRQDLAAERIAPRHGWRVFDHLQAGTPPIYALRLADGGAAVIYLTRERFGWQATSATATLSAPQSAINSVAVPSPSVTRELHVASVTAGLRITLSLVDEHLAIDPPGSGTVVDYFNGKSLAWTKS